MRTELTAEQIESYRENGFVILEDFLTPEELETWRRCTLEAVEQRLDTRMPEGSHALKNQSDPNDFYNRVFTQCLRLADIHDGMHELIFNRDLARMGATLAGVDGLRIWHDQALLKPPYGNPTAWHLDNPYWSFDSRDALSVWVALDDVSQQNGCLYYLPGSHQQAEHSRNTGIGNVFGDLFRVYPEWLGIEPVPAECPAGSAVWHNGLTAHGAGANVTPRPRRAMTCAFMPDGCTYNGKPNILSESYRATLQVGDVLNDEQQNPLVWHKSWANGEG